VLVEVQDAWLLVRASIKEPLIALRCKATAREIIESVDCALARLGLPVKEAAARDPIWSEWRIPE